MTTYPPHRTLIEAFAGPIDGVEAHFLDQLGCWIVVIEGLGTVSVRCSEQRQLLLLSCGVDAELDPDHLVETCGKLLRFNRLWAETGHVAMGLFAGQLLLSREAPLAELNPQRLETLVCDLLAKAQSWRLALLDGHLAEQLETALYCYPADALRV